MIVCYNRCLYCGRMTPHEVCHLHSRAMGRRNMLGSGKGDFGRAMDRAWARHFSRPAEECTDEACPQRLVDWQ